MRALQNGYAAMGPGTKTNRPLSHLAMNGLLSMRMQRYQLLKL